MLKPSGTGCLFCAATTGHVLVAGIHICQPCAAASDIVERLEQDGRCTILVCRGEDMRPVSGLWQASVHARDEIAVIERVRASRQIGRIAARVV